MYKVKEVSEMLGMTEHTVRYYTDVGLVPDVRRDKNNVRIFDQKALNWLKGIQFLKQGGMSVKALQDYVRLCLEGDETAEKRMQIILEQKAYIDAKLEEVQACAQYLENKVKYYEDVMAGLIIDNSNPNNW